MTEEFITREGVTLPGGGNGIKRKNNKLVWLLIDRGFKNVEIADATGLHRNTVFRHKQVYGRMRNT